MADYQVVSGAQLGGNYDADYYYARFPDGHVEQMYAKTTSRQEDPNNPDSVMELVDPKSAKTKSELEAQGVKFSGTDAHGVALADPESGYNAFNKGTNSNDNALMNIGGAVGMGLIGGVAVGGAMAGAGGAEALAAADAAGGLMPEFGSSAAYTAGLESVASINTFLETGQWDAVMGELTGMGDPQSIASVEEALSTQAPAAESLTAPEAMLDAPVGDAPPGSMETSVETGASEAYPGEPTGMDGGPTGMPLPETPGWFEGLKPWQQMGLINSATQVGGGIIKGIGDRDAALELQEKKREEEERLAEWKRRFVQQGSYFDAKPRMAPGNGILKRPDGRPVYAPGGGLVNGGIRGG